MKAERVGVCVCRWGFQNLLGTVPCMIRTPRTNHYDAICRSQVRHRRYYKFCKLEHYGRRMCFPLGYAWNKDVSLFTFLVLDTANLAPPIRTVPTPERYPPARYQCKPPSSRNPRASIMQWSRPSDYQRNDCRSTHGPQHPNSESRRLDKHRCLELTVHLTLANVAYCHPRN